MVKPRLSQRERQIARAYANGDSYRCIAEALFIAPSTVRTHIAAIYRKLDISSKLQLHRALSSADGEIEAKSGKEQPASPEDGSIDNAALRFHSIDDEHPSIVVLPFNNISGNPHQQPFVEGLTEDIISNLSRIHGLLVIARNSSFFYLGAEKSIEEIAKELNVRYVLEGSARTAGEQVRVTAHLVEANTGHQIWTEIYDKSLLDLFHVQDEITQAVASSTQTQVVLNEGDQRRALMDANVQDLRDIAKLGWRYIYDLKAESFVYALVLAEKALRINAAHPCGYQLRASALYHRALQYYSEDRARDLAEARKDIVTALGLDDRDEFSHWIAGLTAFHGERDVTLAINELARATELNPNFSLAYAASGTVYAYDGQFDNAMTNSELALRLNPRDPSNFFRYSAMAVAHFTDGNYEESRRLAEQSLRSGPSWRVAHIIRIASLVLLGQLTAAERAIGNLLVYWPAETVSGAWSLPFIDTGHNETIAHGLRKAGLSDRSETGN